MKTSTGYHPKGGGTPEAVALIRKTAQHIGIKVSGGVKTLNQAQMFTSAGATRIGSNNTSKL